MTREQAINYLTDTGMSPEHAMEIVEALKKTSDKEMIKQFKSIVRGDYITLTKEAYSDLCLRAAGIIKECEETCEEGEDPYEDCISRKELLDAIYQIEYGHDYNEDLNAFDLPYVDIIKALQSVKPTSQKWILTSECLPELKRDVLVFLKNGRFFICALFPGSAGQKYWWIGEEEIHFLFDDVVAWLPLPEPYKEDNA